MLQLVNVGQKSLADYATHRDARSDGRRSGGWPSRCAGKRLVHLSATAFGGGVAEINYALVPLMRGCRPRRRVADHRAARRSSSTSTKTIHNALQGDPRGLTTTQQEVFRRYNALNAEEFEDEYDYVHRPRPAAGGDDRALPRQRTRTGSGAATSTSRRRTPTCSASCCPWLARYDAAIFHMPEYVPRDADAPAGRTSGRPRSTR